MEFLISIPLIGPVFYWVLPFVIVLSIVVAIHELGHLMVGRWCGIKAEVFSVGFGKVLYSRVDKYGTTWQIAAFPLGGFVKFLGDMDPASAGKVEDAELPEEERRYAFHNAALWKRAATVAAGPIANFLLSIIVFFGVFMYVGQPSDRPIIDSIGDLDPVEIGFQPGDEVLQVGDQKIEHFHEVVNALVDADGAELPVRALRDGEEVTFTTRYALPPIVSGITAEGAALAAGMRPGDTILKINGVEMGSVPHLLKVTSNLPLNTEMTVTVGRDGEEKDISFVPAVSVRADPVTGFEREMPLMGISMQRVHGLSSVNDAITIGQAAEGALASVTRIISDTVTYVGRMVFDGATTDHLAGPIGIAKYSAEAAERGLVDLIHMIALISTAIGFLNLLPIPVLDGGHLLFYLIEALRGRPTHRKVVEYSSVAGLSLLLLLMVFVTFNNDLGLGAWLAQD